MKWFKDMLDGSKKHHKQEHSSLDRGELHVKVNNSWSGCMHSLQKKLSCGSAQIASILKTRNHFGNREYLNKNRSHHLPGRPPKGVHK